MKSISLFSGYIYLILAIITGIASNGFLKTTESFTKITPTIFCIISIIVCIFCLSKAMTIIPVGFTYATYGALTITADLLPLPPILTRDQCEILSEADNIVSNNHLTLKNLDIDPKDVEEEMKKWLWRFKDGGQFAKA